MGSPHGHALDASSVNVTPPEQNSHVSRIHEEVFLSPLRKETITVGASHTPRSQLLHYFQLTLIWDSRFMSGDKICSYIGVHSCARRNLWLKE